MYTQEQLDRVIELFNSVEGNKTHDYSAATYKDSPALKEMSEIILSETAETAEVLSEKIPALWYLSECYDQMCRWGLSVKYYKMLLTAHVKLMKLETYDKENTERFESAFYSAVKARNQYLPDACEDLVALVKDSMPEEKLTALLKSAQDSRKGLPKNDPVEMTDAYLAVIDEVEELIEKNKTVNICHEYWSLKSDYLSKRGISWRSPVQLNPGVLFD